jgi:hypothetical protein
MIGRIDSISSSYAYYGDQCYVYKTAVIATPVTSPTKDFEVGEVVGVQFHSRIIESCVYSCRVENGTVRLQESQLKCFTV